MCARKYTNLESLLKSRSTTSRCSPSCLLCFLMEGQFQIFALGVLSASQGSEKGPTRTFPVESTVPRYFPLREKRILH